MRKSFVPASYKTLVSKVSKELSDLEIFVKHRTAESYWRVGKFIHEHLLEHKDRADYGATIFKRLAEDVNFNKSTLQRATQFYRAYPIVAVRRQLNWNHYKSLITIKDKEERKKLEQKVIQKEWDAKKLQGYLSARSGLAASDYSDKPVPPLTFTRGRLNAYGIIAANRVFAKENPLVLDLGFRQQYLIPKIAARDNFKEGDCAELVFEKGELSGVRKIEIPKNELFTYQAKVEKIIDGDTFLAAFDFHLEVSISQKLRLRGIDCPEINTDHGKKAKRFVESQLKGCDFIIVKTHKDRSDKFDRYLADVFYLPKNKKDNEEEAEHATDPAKVAEQGIYLNQELLDNHLAVVWK